jgi:hypothetical protein
VVGCPFLEILLEVAPPSSNTAHESRVTYEADVQLYGRLFIAAVEMIAFYVALNTIMPTR